MKPCKYPYEHVMLLRFELIQRASTSERTDNIGNMPSCREDNN